MPAWLPEEAIPAEQKELRGYEREKRFFDVDAIPDDKRLLRGGYLGSPCLPGDFRAVSPLGLCRGPGRPAPVLAKEITLWSRDTNQAQLRALVDAWNETPETQIKLTLVAGQDFQSKLMLIRVLF